MNSYYRPLPKRINWPVLVGSLRKSYRYGDGGLPADSGIDAGVICDIARRGPYTWDNGTTLWNLACVRLSAPQLADCVPHEYLHTDP